MKSETENAIVSRWEKCKILSGSSLKLIAVITMLIDHAAHYFLYDSGIVILRIAERTLELYELMRYIGRLAFPIYAFLIVEGFIHTSNRKKYGTNLLVFAFISEIPWNLVHSGSVFYESQNVFFTLFFGFLGLYFLEELRGLKRVIALLLLFGVTVVFGADYGCSGFAFILLIYVLREKKLEQAVIGSGVLSSRWIAGLAFIPINMYNGCRGFIRGKFAKYLFYAIYPIHMLLFYFLKYHLMK